MVVMCPLCHTELVVLSGLEVGSNKQQLRGRRKIYNNLLKYEFDEVQGGGKYGYRSHGLFKV